MKGISLVNRIYLGPELDLYFTYKHRGKSNTDVH